MKKTLLVTLFCISAFTTVSSAQMDILDQISFSSDTCEAIDKKIVNLDQFTQMVNNTSAFHLEEKASALPSPGFTVSNNKKKMLRDAQRKREEYLAERKRYGCEAPLPQSRVEVADQSLIVAKTPVSSEPKTVIEKETIKPHESMIKVDTPNKSSVEEKVVALPVPQKSVDSMQTKTVKDKVVSQEPQKDTTKVLVSENAPKSANTMPVTDNTSYSSEACAEINKELIELDQFTTMVNNTSAFHLEEKMSAWPSPGFTVSTNKKKMLRDAEKKRIKLLAEHKKAGCEPSQTK